MGIYMRTLRGILEKGPFHLKSIDDYDSFLEVAKKLSFNLSDDLSRKLYTTQAENELLAIYNDTLGHIEVKPGATPRFCCAFIPHEAKKSFEYLQALSADSTCKTYTAEDAAYTRLKIAYHCHKSDRGGNLESDQVSYICKLLLTLAIYKNYSIIREIPSPTIGKLRM